MTATKPGTGGRRLLWAMAASLLVHACAAGTLCVLPAGTPGDRSVADGLSAWPVLRPVQIALVAEPQPRRGKPASRAAAAGPATPSLLESAIAKAETRIFRPTPMPPANRPRVSATEPPPTAVKPPAPAKTKDLHVAAATATAAKQVQEVRPAASGKHAFAAGGPVADAVSSAGVGGGTSAGGAAGQKTGGSMDGAGISGGGSGGDSDASSGEGSGRGSGGAAAGQAASPAAHTATPVEIVNLPTPEYPPRSRRLGEEGRVLLEIEVLADGRAGKVRVLQAPDFPRLVEAAIEAAKNATFRPATRRGCPVSSIVEVVIRFRLD